MFNIINRINGLGDTYVVEVDELGKLHVACDCPEEAATFFAARFYTAAKLENGVIVEVDSNPYNVTLENGGLKAVRI